MSLIGIRCKLFSAPLVLYRQLQGIAPTRSPSLPRVDWKWRTEKWRTKLDQRRTLITWKCRTKNLTRKMQDRKSEDQIRSKANVNYWKMQTRNLTRKCRIEKFGRIKLKATFLGAAIRRSGCKSRCCSCSCEQHVTVFYYNSPKSHTTTKISIIVSLWTLLTLHWKTAPQNISVLLN